MRNKSNYIISCEVYYKIVAFSTPSNWQPGIVFSFAGVCEIENNGDVLVGIYLHTTQQLP